MKPFFLLLIAASLLTPLRFRASELNFDGLSEYSSNELELNNFSNVIPTDWAFNALNKLAKNRDCNFITRKSDLVSSRKSFTRFEAALIIKTCLQEVSKTSEEEERLVDEFSQEIQSIKNLYKEKNN